ncbi:MAG TPA: SIMPL domain-containing protein [Nitrososphaeraceae archaeon]
MISFKTYDKFLTFTLITFSISLVGLVAYVFSNNTAYAQQPLNLHTSQNNNTSNPNNTLFVTGTANTKVKPDKVILSLGVETNNKTANAALVANSKVMNKVIDALKTAGVKENETSTSSLSISPNYNYSRPSDTIGKITGFTVSNLIQIQSTNIGNVSSWIDTAIASGANTVNSVDFTISDKKLDEIKNNLIKQAIDNAITKADIATSALGLKVVGVKSVNLNSGEVQPPPIPLAKESVAAAAPIANRSTPVISGEQQVNTNVGIVFSIR